LHTPPLHLPGGLVERRCVPLDRSRPFLPIPGSWAAFRVAPFADRREGAAWTARVSCCALYIISLGSVQLLRSAMPHSEKHQQAWPCLGLRESEGEHSLRQPARRMGGYGWMWRLGVYCCDSHLCEDPSLWPRWVSLLLSSSSLVLKFQRHASSVRHEASPRLIHPPHP
jgi:hypothetical protein